MLLTGYKKHSSHSKQECNKRNMEFKITFGDRDPSLGVDRRSVLAGIDFRAGWVLVSRMRWHVE